MAINCQVTLIKEATNDLMLLPDEVFDEYLIMEEKLKKNIHLGQPLMNKNGKNLSDCYKIYFNNAKYRIVYRKKNNECEVVGIEKVPKMIAEIIAVGKRNQEQVYQDAVNRLGR